MSSLSTRKSLGLPPIPRTQALTTTTFRPPPLDGSLSVPELYDWHLENSPDHPLFVYSDNDGAATTITWKEAARAVHRAGHLVCDMVQKSPEDKPSRAVIAILANNDSIMYFTLIAAITRAGHVAFPISPRNSPAAVAHLVSKMGVSHMFVGSEDALQDLFAAASRLLDESKSKLPDVAQFPLYAEVYDANADAPLELLPPMQFEWGDPLVILHSSGSTAFPKPLVYTHERLLLACLAPWFGEQDLTGKRLSCHSMPMYHGMGVMQVGWTAFSGLILTVFKSQIPVVVPSPESVMKGAMDTNSDIIFCVPSFIEAWAKQPNCVRWLKDTQGIIFGGGPLAKEVGDDLTKQGVTIFVMYGNTECGINNVILPKEVDKDWEYFAFPANVKPQFLPCGDGNSELVLMSHQLQKVCKTNVEMDGIHGYATSDIMSPHPTKPGFWKIYGRLDDQIMHSTGEKTNPGPLEAILVQDPLIKSVVMFGRGKFYAGLLIDPASSEHYDLTREQDLIEYRNRIWPTVEKMNQFAPQHSRIFKEMIILSSPTKPFTYTAKNTPRRQAIILDYEQEIESLYASAEKAIQDDSLLPTTWDLEHILPFVRTIVHRILEHTVSDGDDIFQNGCDSLQATWIRGTLLHAMRTAVDTQPLPNNFVHQHPNIYSLAEFIEATLNSGYVPVSQEYVIQRMKDMAAKYSADLPTQMPAATASTEAQAEDVVLVTGTTGVLGTALLAELVSSPDISRIYALNRGSEQSTSKRQRASLQKQAADPDAILASSKVIWIEVDMAAENLGLPTAIVQEIRTNVTHFILNAWPLNFNYTLLSFEPNIRSVRFFVDLALTSSRQTTPRVIFCSSAGVLRNSNQSSPSREAQISPDVAVGSGYTESKWVVERLLQNVSELSSLRPVTIRIGQLCGSKTGFWNEAEWFPSLVKSSSFLRCFPSLDKSISLLFVEDAARAIREMRNSDSPVLHLAHPYALNWHTIVETVTQTTDLQTVPYNVWFDLLRKSANTPSSEPDAHTSDVNPALKLMGFFADAEANAQSAQAMGFPHVDTRVTQTVSPWLRELCPPSKDIISQWIRECD